MRFVWAVAAFVLAAVMIGAGIAQRTIFQGPRTETASISVEEDAPYLLIDGAVLNQMPGTQTLRVQGEGELFAAYGRAADVQAWLSDAEYNRVTVDDGEIVTRLVEPEPVEPEPGEAETGEGADSSATASPDSTEPTDAATEPPGRNPLGSDLWLDEFQQADILIAPLQLPEDMSVLVASDGTTAAPSTVSVSWPLQTTTPWAGPLIVGGGILMAAGVFLYILGIRHARRSRGPRRKGLPLPPTEPIDLAVDGADKGVISTSGAPTRRRAVTSGRRAFAVLPAVAVSALLFTGCSADAWPQFGATPTPTPTETVIAPEGQQAPAVTKPQAERILTRIASTIADADTAMDAELAATRLEGAALAARETNYKIRATLTDYQAPAAILSKPLKVILPQAFDGWPRSVIAVADDAASKTSSIMLMTQQDAWSDYKLSYIASLEASTPLPDLAPWYIGATQVEPDSPFLVMPPEQIAAAYADVIDKGEESEFFDLFDAEGDQMRTSIAADRQRRLDEFNQTGSGTGTFEFQASAGTQPPFALATIESGAIVAVNVHETDTVRPTNPDAVIKTENNPRAKVLTGADQSATGFSTTYTDQVFFYVPGSGSGEKIRLLGYSSDILDAKVIP
ncbi:glycosyl transferase [Microbacterium sp. HD4P20]|uniref:glycosyl transferase n=1 Tax=Microbacterium sp. HD4P20 TaxID=2864874 RepID=UPI001C641A83|nr:glycosyl transferase [Microbacterium sp. HD4P20]MCP2636708.1 glycosyl transferase [Microbacterium sp. HD4P20]